MRKFLFFGLFIIWSLCASSQIQRRFLNFTLGQTSKAEVTNYFTIKGYRVRLLDENTVAVNDVRFGGQTWGVTHLQFYKNKLYGVSFMSSEHDYSKENLDMMWEILDKSLERKYSRYYLKNFSKELDKWFDDDRTRIWFKYEYFQNAWALSILYYDIRLYDEKSDKDENEL